MPELVVGLPIAKALQRVLREKGGGELLLVIAGSGMGPEGGRPVHQHPDEVLQSAESRYNTSFAFSGKGDLLWGQSKMHPFPYHAGLLEDVGISGASGSIEESLLVGSKLVVFEGSFGRCVTLICEDLARVQGTDWLHTALSVLRPDWIFNPVLDRSIVAGRWFHQDALPLVKNFDANVLTVNSLVIERRTHGSSPGIGLLVGRVRGETRQRVLQLDASAGPIAIVDWRPDDWPFLNIS